MLSARVTPDELRRAMEVYARHGTILNAAKELDVSRSTLRRWLSQAQLDGKSEPGGPGGEPVPGDGGAPVGGG